MAGVRRFDEEEVLDQAMRVFWQRGYEATAIDDLVEAMGLKRGSLYNAFGDKERLFLLVLARYKARVERPLLDALNDPDPRRGIERMFELQISGLLGPDFPGGCLIANTIAEAGHREDAVSQAVRRAAADAESAVYDSLRRAQAAGQLDPSHDARALARFFFTVSLALAQLHRCLVDARYLRDVARSALLVLDAPSGSGGCPAT